MGCRCVSCHDFGALGSGWEGLRGFRSWRKGEGEFGGSFRVAERNPTGAQQKPRGGQEEPKRSPRGAQEEAKKRQRGAHEEPSGGQEEPKRNPREGLWSPEAENTGPRARPTKTFGKTSPGASQGSPREAKRRPRGPKRSPRGAKRRPREHVPNRHFQAWAADALTVTILELWARVGKSLRWFRGWRED